MRRRLAMPILFAVLVFRIPAPACARGEIVITTCPNFSVRVTNSRGPVAGLRVSVTRFPADEYSRAIADNRSALERSADAIADTIDNTPHRHSAAARAKAINIKDYVDLIATSVTDGNGAAHFHLDAVGSFTLEADNPVADIDGILLNVSRDATSAVVDMRWPGTSILETRSVKGHIEDGLYKSTSEPLKEARVSLHEFISYREVAVTATTEGGSFYLPTVPAGLYFLAVKAKEEGLNPPEGNIAIFVSPSARRDSLSVAVAESDCGLSYDLVENKSKHKPVACFRDGKQVPCQY